MKKQFGFVLGAVAAAVLSVSSYLPVQVEAAERKVPYQGPAVQQRMNVPPSQANKPKEVRRAPAPKDQNRFEKKDQNKFEKKERKAFEKDRRNDKKVFKNNKKAPKPPKEAKRAPKAPKNAQRPDAPFPGR
ncbi:MAG: hypothetical protein ACFWT7_08515 [Succiniclasticum sp.]|jgi:hypothetical protein